MDLEGGRGETDCEAGKGRERHEGEWPNPGEQGGDHRRQGEAETRHQRRLERTGEIEPDPGGDAHRQPQAGAPHRGVPRGIAHEPGEDIRPPYTVN